MCGIVGIFELGHVSGTVPTSIKSMADAVVHRGPDDEGYALFNGRGVMEASGPDTGPCEPDSARRIPPGIETIINEPLLGAFGHRRLAILDTSYQGHQPMSLRGRYWITYNGEVFNYLELRKELHSSGYVFDSATDTEVVLAAYDKWGPECVTRFNGMWAFAVYDAATRRLFMSRDRFGIKPLYYRISGRRFAFASEIKALLRLDWSPVAPDEAYCRDYLLLGPNEFGRQTAFTGIRRFPHACYHEGPIEDLATNGVTPIEYWHLSPNTSNEKYCERAAQGYAGEYLSLLSDAVRLRLRADVKVGTALSGGLDSSSIAFLAAQHSGDSELLETFSNVYTTAGTTHCDESGYIKELADFLHVRSNTVEPHISEIPDQHRLMIYAMENPAVGPNMGGWYTFKRIAKSDVVINLDGQGADEQLGGYHSFVWRYIANMRFDDAVRELLAFSTTRGVNKRKLVGSLGMNLARRAVPPHIVDRLVRRTSSGPSCFPVIGPLNCRLVEAMETNLVNLLHYGDSQSMAHTVESRVPFLDYRMVEFLASVPAAYKIHNGWTKYLARLAFGRLLPARIVWRQDKMGWPDPTDYWFKGPLRGWLTTRVENSDFLRCLGLDADIDARITSRAPVLPLVRMLNLSVWFDVFFDSMSSMSLPSRPRGSY